jgi:glutathione peroxidase
MHTLAAVIVGLVVLLVVARVAMANPVSTPAPPMPKDVLGFTMKDIDGNDVPLSKYAGKVLLIVNVASKCGNTPQYKPLEALYEKYKDRGFDVLAFPANNFAFQEPGANAQIKQFCTLNYNVTFPLFSKISVKGSDIDPLYRFLTDKQTDPSFGGDIEWNFAKFLIDRNGNIVNRFKAGHSPDSPDVVASIEDLLNKPAAM